MYLLFLFCDLDIFKLSLYKILYNLSFSVTTLKKKKKILELPLNQIKIFINLEIIGEEDKTKKIIK